MIELHFRHNIKILCSIVYFDTNIHISNDSKPESTVALANNVKCERITENPHRNAQTQIRGVITILVLLDSLLGLFTLKTFLVLKRMAVKLKNARSRDALKKC